MKTQNKQLIPLFKADAGMPLWFIRGNNRRQAGASLIAAIFLITALAILGGFLVKLVALGSEETITELMAGQALYAAESGVEWSARDLSAGGGGATVNAVVIANRAWVSTIVATVTINGVSIHTITSTGIAGENIANPRAQRQIVVQFMP